MHPLKNHSLPEATKKMECYCTYQDRCRKDVTEKLKGMRVTLEEIDQIIAHLLQEDYLNEERFAKNFARGKFRIKKWGRNRIVNELEQRQISSPDVKSALAEIDEDDYLNALDGLAKKKLAQIHESNLQKKRKKLANYLLYRGWETHLVHEKVRALS